jgi:hypothetical protein
VSLFPGIRAELPEGHTPDFHRPEDNLEILDPILVTPNFFEMFRTDLDISQLLALDLDLREHLLMGELRSEQIPLVGSSKDYSCDPLPPPPRPPSPGGIFPFYYML